MMKQNSFKDEGHSLDTTEYTVRQSGSAEAPSRIRLAAALLSYPLAYFYVWGMLLGDFFSWGSLLFSLMFIAWVLLFARGTHRTPCRETGVWAAALVVQSAAMLFFGGQSGWLPFFQILVWHLFAIWFSLSCTGMLSSGSTGSLFFLDAMAGLFLLPWSAILRRIGTLIRALRARFIERRAHRESGRFPMGVLLSIAAAVLLCAFAWSQLAAVDDNFAALGRYLSGWLWEIRLPWETLMSWAVYFILSLPVGAWLFGLAAGGLDRREAPITAKRFFDALAPWQHLPAVTVKLVVGALCAVYGLFFGVQVLEFSAADAVGLSAPEAASFAVDGFWELCTILLLNFAVLAAVRFFSGEPLWKSRGQRGLAAVFCAFGIAFAGLDGAKLAAYIRLYGYTPRRVLSGWFLCILALWAVLALIWVLQKGKRIRVASIGIWVLVAGFLLLSCADVNRRIIRANISRYDSGVDQELDLDILYQCGVGSYGLSDRNQSKYAGWLIDAGWFEGRELEELEELYLLDRFALSDDSGTLQTALEGDEVLVLGFEKGKCTSAKIAKAQTDKIN